MKFPRHLTLGEVIDRLKGEDPERRVPLGFARPHSYRGYYHDLAFEIERDVTVGEMLAAAYGALGSTYEGWKGGDYTMDSHTDVWLVREEGDVGESMGAVLLDLMLRA